jgi:molybdopterin-guanine dinucleotide biosynthesis protein A
VAERSVLAAVLAGGLGSRLGGGKAVAEIAGRPLVSYPIDAARAAGLETVVVAKPDTALPQLDVEVLLEPEEPRHPLCGVLAALDARDADVLALACDMPFLTPALLEWLAGLDGAIVLAAADRLQPLPGRYPAASRDRIAEAIRAEEPMGATLASLRARRVDAADLERFGEPARLLFNVNEPVDLRYAEQMLAMGA